MDPVEEMGEIAGEEPELLVEAPESIHEIAALPTLPDDDVLFQEGDGRSESSAYAVTGSSVLFPEDLEDWEDLILFMLMS